jgi:DNA-binding transcriptional LysR family regulator
LVGLEERVGARLITRSRARSTATEAGQGYYRALKTLLEQLERVEDDLADIATAPRGLLRVTARGARELGKIVLNPWRD